KSTLSASNQNSFIIFFCLNYCYSGLKYHNAYETCNKEILNFLLRLFHVRPNRQFADLYRSVIVRKCCLSDFKIVHQLNSPCNIHLASRYFHVTFVGCPNIEKQGIITKIARLITFNLTQNPLINFDFYILTVRQLKTLLSYSRLQRLTEF